MRPFTALLLLLFAFAALTVRAENVGGLYEAEVPVSSQDNASRDAAVRAAFRDVLVKLTGSRNVLQNPGLAPVLPQAANYLTQFYFRRAQWPPDESGATGQATVLHASFQPVPVERLLRDSGEALLSANRPGTLVLLVIDDGSGTRRLLNADTDPLIATWIGYHAAARAIPLVFPLLDLEEPITAEQVWADDEPALAAAAARYGAPVMITGRISSADGSEWTGEWRWRIDGEQGAGGGGAAGIGDVAAQLVDSVGELLNQRFAIHNSLENAEELRIRVDGVGSFATYHQIASMLGKLQSVRQAKPALLEGETVFFDLLTDSGIDSVLQEISLLPRLQPEGGPQDRRYRWSGD